MLSDTNARQKITRLFLLVATASCTAVEGPTGTELLGEAPPRISAVMATDGQTHDNDDGLAPTFGIGSPIMVNYLGPVSSPSTAQDRAQRLRRITISGSGFGSAKGTVAVSVPGYFLSDAEIVSWAPDQIVMRPHAALDAEPALNASITVTRRDGGQAVNSAPFRIDWIPAIKGRPYAQCTWWTALQSILLNNGDPDGLPGGTDGSAYIYPTSYFAERRAIVPNERYVPKAGDVWVHLAPGGCDPGICHQAFVSGVDSTSVATDADTRVIIYDVQLSQYNAGTQREKKDTLQTEHIVIAESIDPGSAKQRATSVRRFVHADQVFRMYPGASAYNVANLVWRSGALHNSRPQVTIRSPANASILSAAVDIDFEAVAFDTEDGALSPNVQWTLEVGGNATMQDGPAFTRRLAIGEHRIIVTAQDPHNATVFGADTVNIDVIGGSCPAAFSSASRWVARDAEETCAPPPTGVTIAVQPTTANLTVGQTVQLSATVTGTSESGVSWESSDVTRATVGQQTGLVTAVAAGVTTITAHSTADPTKFATATINIAAQEPSTVTVSASASPPEGGTVTGGGSYRSGEQVQLTAAPSPGYVFVGWYEGADWFSADPSIGFSAATNRVLVARFVSVSGLTVTGAGTGRGSVSATGIFCSIDRGSSSGDCAESYASNVTVVLTAAPATGSSFVEWAGACSGAGPCTLDMRESRVATARFDAISTLDTLLIAIPHPLKIATASEMIYWIEDGFGDGAIRSRNTVSGDQLTIASGLLQPNALAIDESHVYWLEWGNTNGRLKRAPLSGGASELLASNLRGAQGFLAQDATSLYFSDGRSGGGGAIRKIAKSGGSIVTLVNDNMNSSPAIATDGSFAYFHDDNGSIRRVPVSGGTIETIASGSPSSLHVVGSYLVWQESTTGEIKRMPKSGGSVITLAIGALSGSGLAADDSHAFWIDGQSGGGVFKVPMVGGERVSISSAGGTYAIALDGTHVYWISSSRNMLIRARK